MPLNGLSVPFAGVSDFVGVCGAFAGGGSGFGCATNGNAPFESAELPIGLEMEIGVCICSCTCTAEPATPVVMLPPLILTLGRYGKWLELLNR